MQEVFTYMHLRAITITFAAVAFSVAASAQPAIGPAGVLVNPGVFNEAYQLNYLASNGGTVQGSITMTNAGTLGADAFGPLSGTTGDICVNVYTFTADEQESECCQCLVTPNALRSLTAAQLTGNPGNGVTPTLGLVVKLLVTVPGTATNGIPAGSNTQTTFTGTTCNAAQTFTTDNLAPGMRAWAVDLHTVGAVTGVAKTAFVSALLSPGELAKLTNLCQFLKGNQSGAGVCAGCALGGLGAGKR